MGVRAIFQWVTDFMLCFQASEGNMSETVKSVPVGEGPSRSATIRRRSAVSRSAELSPDVVLEPWSPDQGQEGFPDRVYLLASVIFQNDRLEKPADQCKVNYGGDRELPLPEVKGEEMQHAAYQLAFNTLKCECAFEDTGQIISSVSAF